MNPSGTTTPDAMAGETAAFRSVEVRDRKAWELVAPMMRERLIGLSDDVTAVNEVAANGLHDPIGQTVPYDALSGYAAYQGAPAAAETPGVVLADRARSAIDRAHDANEQSDGVLDDGLDYAQWDGGMASNVPEVPSNADQPYAGPEAFFSQNFGLTNAAEQAVPAPRADRAPAYVTEFDARGTNTPEYQQMQWVKDMQNAMIEEPGMPVSGSLDQAGTDERRQAIEAAMRNVEAAQ